MTTAHDPELDLVLERVLDIRPELVWAAWTQPEHITKWFTPAPWTTPEAALDVWPGGQFHTVMCSPEGERVDNTGCFLEVVDQRKLVWTSALGPGYRRSDLLVLDHCCPRPPAAGSPAMPSVMPERALPSVEPLRLIAREG